MYELADHEIIVVKSEWKSVKITKIFLVVVVVILVFPLTIYGPKAR